MLRWSSKSSEGGTIPGEGTDFAVKQKISLILLTKVIS
jgi:hypothetical protein